MMPAYIEQDDIGAIYQCPYCNKQYYLTTIKSKCPLCKTKYKEEKDKPKKVDEKPEKPKKVKKDYSVGYILINGERRYRIALKERNVVVPKGYTVHHMDFDKTNDDIENLYICKLGEHGSFHIKKNRPEKSNWRDFITQSPNP